MFNRSSANFPFHRSEAQKAEESRKGIIKRNFFEKSFIKKLKTSKTGNKKTKNKGEKNATKETGNAIKTSRLLPLLLKDKKEWHMRRVMIKKRKLEKEFNNLKLVFVVYDVCEVSKNENGSTEINISQIYDVLDVWNFQDFDELFA